MAKQKKKPDRCDPDVAPEVEAAADDRQLPEEATPAAAAPERESLDGGASEAAPIGAHKVIFGDEAADREPDRIEQLRAELAGAQDRALRSQAELENYRKRAARQADEERRYANLPLMRDLLPVVDNMHRAIDAAATEKAHDAASLLEGVKMVAEQFEGVLQRHHCVRIEALNEPFDPHRHEAVSQQPSDEHPANTVLLVTQTGFQLHDRVVRPSQVIVSTEASE